MAHCAGAAASRSAASCCASGAPPDAARRRLNRVAWQLVACALIAGATTGVRSYLFNSASERVVARLRSRLFRSLLRQDMGFFDTNTSGNLLSRISADTELFANFVIKIFEQLAASASHRLIDLQAKLKLKLVEGTLNFLMLAAALVDVRDALFKINATFDGPQHLVASPKDAFEELELFGQ
jgi:ABC-type multidrug transport system fused ATPase/permease subunit